MNIDPLASSNIIQIYFNTETRNFIWRGKGKYSIEIFRYKKGKSVYRLSTIIIKIKRKKGMIDRTSFHHNSAQYRVTIRSNGSCNYSRRISWLDWQGRRQNSYGHCPRSCCCSSRGFVGSRRRSRLVWRKGSPLFSDNRGWFVNCRADWRKEAPVQGIRHLATPSIDWIALEIATVLSFSRRRRTTWHRRGAYDFLIACTHFFNNR